MAELSQAPLVWRASDTRLYPPRPYPRFAFVNASQPPEGVPAEMGSPGSPSPSSPRWNRRVVALVIAGILALGAAFATFLAVTRGSGGSAITAACKSETADLRKAQDRYQDMTHQYGDITELQVAGFASTPVFHDVVRPTGQQYIIVVKDPRCGVPGHHVGQTATDY